MKKFSTGAVHVVANAIAVLENVTEDVGFCLAKDRAIVVIPSHAAHAFVEDDNV